MDIITIVFIVWYGFLNYYQATPQSAMTNNYKVAKYSIKVDYFKLHDIVPGLPLFGTSYKYYIQYGNNICIQLSDPGDDIDNLPILVSKFDYSQGVCINEIILNNVKKYYRSIDSCSYSIEKSKGTIIAPCKGQEIYSECDSLKFI